MAELRGTVNVNLIRVGGFLMQTKSPCFLEERKWGKNAWYQNLLVRFFLVMAAASRVVTMKMVRSMEARGAYCGPGSFIYSLER